MVTQTKQLWEMTRREVSLSFDMPDPELTRSILDNHEKAVKLALSSGKNVPDNVLKDYPELKKSIDKSVQSGIMTSETGNGGEYDRIDNGTKDKEIERADAGNVQPGGSRDESLELHKTEQARSKENKQGS